jgi:hypothetical protein
MRRGLVTVPIFVAQSATYRLIGRFRNKIVGTVSEIYKAKVGCQMSANICATLTALRERRQLVAGAIEKREGSRGCVKQCGHIAMGQKYNAKKFHWSVSLTFSKLVLRLCVLVSGNSERVRPRKRKASFFFQVYKSLSASLGSFASQTDQRQRKNELLGKYKNRLK